jgi:hypothetical protein
VTLGSLRVMRFEYHIPRHVPMSGDNQLSHRRLSQSHGRSRKSECTVRVWLISPKRRRRPCEHVACATMLEILSEYTSFHGCTRIARTATICSFSATLSLCVGSSRCRGLVTFSSPLPGLQCARPLRHARVTGLPPALLRSEARARVLILRPSRLTSQVTAPTSPELGR